MLTHKLRILILRQLNKGERAGYGLIKDIEAATGWKPSYGSIYPQLDHMHKEKLIAFKEQGKKKIYTLTKQGKAALKALERQHGQFVSQMRDNHKLLLHLCGIERDPLGKTFFDELEEGKVPFAPIVKASQELKAEVGRIYAAGLLERKAKHINAALKEATKKLRTIR